MSGGKRLRPRPKPAEVKTAVPRPAAPVSRYVQTAQKDECFFAFCFPSSGMVENGTLEIGSLNSAQATVLLTAKRGDEEVRRKYAVKVGRNDFGSTKVKAGDKITLSISADVSEIWVSFLFREA